MYTRENTKIVDSDEFAVAEQYCRSHDTCMLSIAFSDVVGYTALCERHSESQVLASLRDLQSIGTSVLESQHGGQILKWIGDAVLCVFTDPVSAVTAIVALHQAVKQQRIFKESLQLRSGIHTGMVAVESQGFGADIFGRHVNRTARVQSAAEPGEILATDVVEDNVWSWSCANKSNFTFSRRRQLQLKGIERAVTVYRVETLRRETDSQARLLDQLAQELEDIDPDVRIRAACRIGGRNLNQLVAPLSQMMLSDKSPAARAYAAWAIDQLHVESAVDSLIRALSDISPDVRGNAGWALVHLGIVARTALERVEKWETSDAGQMAALVLQRISGNGLPGPSIDP